MARRTKAAVAAGQPASAEPTEFVGRNDRGAVRPADDRYLEDAELDARDAYVLEQSGPEAQQLIAKRDALRIRLERLTDDELGQITGLDVGAGVGRTATVERLTAAATTMPNAQYRELLASIDEALADHAHEEPNGQ